MFCRERRALIGTIFRDCATLATLCGTLCASINSPVKLAPELTPLSQLERSVPRAPFHISQFSSASAPLALPSCGSVRPPESLLTPDPLPNVQTEELAVRVSFIVGVDGHVHSAFVLESGGSDEDEVVLRTVRLWRYRRRSMGSHGFGSASKIQHPLAGEFSYNISTRVI